MKDKDIQCFFVPQSLFNDPALSIQRAGSFQQFATLVVSSLDKKSIQQIAHDLGLSFVPQKEKESEVCFINSEEVRPEFKLSFAPVDLSDYILATLKRHWYDHLDNLRETPLLPVPYPKNAVDFWELVETGEQLRRMI